MKFRKSFKVLLLLLMVLSTFTLVACKGGNDQKDPPAFDYTDLSVRDYVGKNGVVAAANPYAAKAGLDVLQAGGNAFDAAVAVSFALGVVEPNASGLGGGGILVAYEASTGGYVSYNFREFVPGAGVASAFPNEDADIDGGIKSSGVPTQVAGLLEIQENHGSLTRQKVMEPAINYANNGVKVTPELASAINENWDKVVGTSGDQTYDIFTSDGFTPLKAGDTLIQENYGNVLEEISEKGAEGFYKGWVADAIVASQVQHGGIITHDDLLYAMDNYPKVETPIVGNYRGYDIASANIPSSGGIILIEALNMLEHYGDLAALGHNSPEYINTIATAMALAYGDKRQYIADDEFVDVPVTGLINKSYAQSRWDEVYRPGKAFLGRNAVGGSKSDDYGNPWDYVSDSLNIGMIYDDSHDYIEHYSTTTFSISDKWGNIVSVTQTINYFFGNGVVPENCGFYLNNELSSFSFTTSSVHYIEPYKQPVSHIMPTIIMKDGNPWATLGSPGGLRIPSAVIQVVLNLIDFEMDIQSAISAPRVYTYAAGSDDHGANINMKDLYVEKGIVKDKAVQSALTAMGYYVIPTGEKEVDLYFGGVQGIRFNEEEGTMHGGADIRRDGKALGY